MNTIHAHFFLEVSLFNTSPPVVTPFVVYKSAIITFCWCKLHYHSFILLLIVWHNQ